MRVAIRRLQELLESSYVTLVIGLVLVVTSIFEMVDSGLERVLGFEIGAHHGVLAWGTIQVFRGLGHVISEVMNLREGLEDLSRRGRL